MSSTPPTYDRFENNDIVESIAREMG